MRWEEEYEEIPEIGCIEILETNFIHDADNDVTVTFRLPLNKWNTLSRTKAWEEVCAMIESDKAQIKRRIGF